MFTSVKQCVEPITQPCQNSVKFTIEGHEFEPLISCLLHISVFIKFCSNVQLSKSVCINHDLAMQTRGQEQCAGDI